MNIVNSFSITSLFNTANPSTGAARPDNISPDTIPQTSNANANANANNNAENSESEEQRQQEQVEQAEIRELQTRDTEVRAHEQAHAAVGGQYAGTPQYEFETGPDGQRYAVGGEVSIDVSEESTPEQTLRKLTQVRAAALAPVEPSAQDFRVAAEAARGALEAQAEINRASSEETQSTNEQPDPNVFTPPSPSLDNVSLEESDDNNRFFDNRNGIISQFYERTVNPQTPSLSTSA